MTITQRGLLVNHNDDWIRSSTGFSYLRPGALDISLPDTQNTTERVERKEKTRTLGQLQAQEEEVCDTFVQLSVHLQAIAGVYFAWNFHKATWNADSSLWLPCFHVHTASFGWLCPSLAAISSRLFSSALVCQQPLSDFCGPFFRPPLRVAREISPAGPLCGFRAKTEKKRSLTDASSNRNECYHTVSNISNNSV